MEGLYYPCSENKGADKLRVYREVDLRLCFLICKNPVSHDAAHLLTKFYGCTTRFVSGLIRNPVYFTTLRIQII